MTVVDKERQVLEDAYALEIIILQDPEEGVSAEIISFDNDKIEVCNYEDTESYQVMEIFINNQEILTERLLKDV